MGTLSQLSLDSLDVEVRILVYGLVLVHLAALVSVWAVPRSPVHRTAPSPFGLLLCLPCALRRAFG